MITWVMYDIENDRARTKVARLCKQSGLYRVQYSVFLGSMDAEARDTLQLQLEELIDPEKDKVYNTYKTQLFCYAWLIEDNFGKPANRAYLVYTRSKNKVVEVAVEPEDKAAVREAAEAIRNIIQDNHFPKATRYKSRCVHCTYRNICIR